MSLRSQGDVGNEQEKVSKIVSGSKREFPGVKTISELSKEISAPEQHRAVRKAG